MEYFLGIKQSPRKVDDIAIVNAGMKVRFSKGSTIVESLRLAYGGMASTTVMATKTTVKLIGRSVVINSSLFHTFVNYINNFVICERCRLYYSCNGDTWRFINNMIVKPKNKFKSHK